VAAAEIEADHELAEGEQHRRKQGAGEHMAPRDGAARQHGEDEGEEKGGHPDAEKRGGWGEAHGPALDRGKMRTRASDPHERATSRGRGIAAIMAKVSSRDQTKCRNPVADGALVFQMTLRSDCSSAKAPVAVTRKVTMPITVPTTPEPILLALARTLSIAAAPD